MEYIIPYIIIIYGIYYHIFLYHIGIYDNNNNLYDWIVIRIKLNFTAKIFSKERSCLTDLNR